MRVTLYLLLLLICSGLRAQTFPPTSSTANRINSTSAKNMASAKSTYANIKAENIGPTVMSGRVVDLDVNPEAPHEFYVAYASGGLWKTINNGASFEPLFQQEIVMTIGDIDVNWETGEVWVGTGEVNSSRSSYSGVGVFHSIDWGETWTHRGLDDTHHIGRVIIDSANPNKIYVASLGHLYSKNEARGVYVSEDRGLTWKKTLYISDKTGVVDLIQDPQKPNTLYAAAWERDRKAWNFVESGSESGIYKSSDGGTTWARISNGNNGFPATSGTGRIGLTMTYDSYQNATIYALLDNYDRQEKSKESKEGLALDDFKTMTIDAFIKLEDEKLDEFLRDNYFPEKYTAKSVKKMAKAEKVKPVDLATYLEDANKLLIDSPVIGASLYKSTDEGTTWTKTHEDLLERVYNSYGYYFGVVQVAPESPETVYIAGVPLYRSQDGGKTFDNIGKENVHADHHALWINPKNINHIINGNDGGVNISYDAGANYFKCNSPTVGQFYAINVDHAEPYNVYGGLQDNGVWMGSHQYNAGVSWHQRGQYPYRSIMGGDGMQIAVDTRDNKTVYTGFQFGNYFRINTETNDREYITPKHELGDSPYRWNWQTPVMLSSHNQDILYMGANRLMRSMNQGKDFTAISPDLTNGGRKGDVAYGTLTSISESKLQFGLMYTGSDDGMLYRTMNGGATWDKITEGLPEEFWVSRIEASSHDLATVYMSLNGYRWDNFEALVYRSTDYGNSWNKISSGLPDEPVNVIKEDPHYPEILYVGTDHSTYISKDYGTTFELISNEIPKVAVHDLVIHKRDKDLLIGTHGRSIYKIDLDPIYAQREAPESDFIVQEDLIGRASSRWGNKNWQGILTTADTEIPIYARAGGKMTVRLETKNGDVLKKYSQEIPTGFSYINVDYSIDKKKEVSLRKYVESASMIEAREDEKIYLEAGEYVYVFQLKDKEEKMKITLK